ncbi:hypothetical protein ACFQXB_00145 [Plastorhodobacter daqingensis]|uniref:Capsular biosynthesis protein n=1 Tax=Plastorhodobacter daqingensis TaxID=1387281 RepID=A0ABW2UF47_9RHOB
MAPRQLNIILEGQHRRDAEAGKINIFNRITKAFSSSGYQVAYRDLDDLGLSPPPPDCFALYFMQEPASPRALTLRRAYHYPFWRIEATNERWHTDVARATFDPEKVDPALATPFARRWRRTLFADRVARREGFVFVPLQGRLLERRSFQAESPVAMIHTLREADTKRRIVLKLHPKERYEPAEMEAIEQLCRDPRIVLSDADPLDLLAGCDYVVTQNSGLALTGFFMGKRAIVFARIDYHHIAGSVPEVGVKRAFATLEGPAPAFDRYLHWFLQENAVNGGRDDAEHRILARAARFGWPSEGPFAEAPCK